MADAYVTGLRMLARRELSEAQIRIRLTRRQFEPDEVDEAVEKLRRDGSLDDRRTAMACARTEAHVKRHGQRRALQQLQAIGIARDLAASAVKEVFADVDEDHVIEQILERRLRQPGGSERTRPTLRRVHRYLLTQGFDAARVNAAIRSRVRHVPHDD